MVAFQGQASTEDRHFTSTFQADSRICRVCNFCAAIVQTLPRLVVYNAHFRNMDGANIRSVVCPVMMPLAWASKYGITSQALQPP